MAEEAPAMKRDNTMVATAKEGEAFLEATGGVAEDAKTRAQQKELESTEEVPKLTKDNTMVTTAKEGAEILGDDELGGTRAETKAIKDAEAAEEDEEDEEEEDEEGEEEDDDDDEENGEEEAGDTNDAPVPAVKRTHTMADTLQEGEEYLKRQKTDENGEKATENGENGESAEAVAS